MDNTQKTQALLINLDRARQKIKEKRDKWMSVYFVVPILIFAGALSTFVIPLIIIGTFISIAVSRAIYHAKYTAPFQELSNKVKGALLGEFMRIYHPDTTYTYFPNGHKVEKIISESKLISADRFDEEDVIVGTKGGVDFYLSEVDLQKKIKSKNKTTYHTIVKGLLFKIKIPGRSFPKSVLFSNPSLLKKWFRLGRQNEEYGFWYETRDESRFHSEMQTLFPFIQHLSQRGDVRISTSGDEITILMESKMKFLDDPVPSLNKSFQDERYYSKISKQVNSLFYIIDTFVDDMSPLEIEENLKLRVLEYAERKSVDRSQL